MAHPDFVNIAPAGDVVLVCGTGDMVKKLRVSSAILSQASSVFKALFSPRFEEGTELKRSMTVEIPLPDDEPTTMAIICNILHMRNNNVPYALKPEEIVDLAILTDKYACMEPLKFAGNVWIQPHLATNNPAQLCTLMTAAFYFQDAQLFQSVCRNIVWRSIGSIQAHEGLKSDVLFNVFGCLDKQRMKAFSEITDIIENAAHELFPAACVKSNKICSGCRKLLSFTNELAKQQLWPGSARGNQVLGHVMKELQAPQLAPGLYDGCSNYYPRPEVDRIIKQVRVKAHDLETRIMLSCLDCVRKGKTGLASACDHM